ncbi:tRNA lysidine(34) synthetase TilS [Oxalicibacterium faecigallinarum]|uniref:tRNA lysidine(34) synthetase TilS n=1 Tax=Oxalicibacterium faecigallinarum TaxID=573741 RepID=UPI00166AA9BC|nr:tRNA lysidine(34) synthetase TilS [Oxalicibacterium faecigallinarum]
MASSRNSTQRSNVATSFVLQNEFERALGEIRTRVSLCATVDSATASAPALSIAIAFSGGLDSAVLLHLAHVYVKQHGGRLHAFHVHHGLSPHADEWAAHCRKTCDARGIAFDMRQICLEGTRSIEEAARKRRYAALGEMCRTHAVSLLLTAHHQDDQAETVLLQLLRGSGVAGLSGMDRANQAADLLGDDALWMGRPLLDISRDSLEAWAQQHQLLHVEDESNADPRYARNALRHHVMPLIATDFPGFQQRFVRTAQHMQSAQRLLIELAEQDLSACLVDHCIDVAKLAGFSRDRVDNLLRYWFGSRGVRMPSTAWLNEMRAQLFEAKEDAQLCVTHADCEIHRYRQKVFMTPRIDPAALPQAAQAFVWAGESSLYFPAFGGTLHIEPAEEGMSAAWLAAQSLCLDVRRGGEVLKLAANRPTRSLKAHYQAGDVPPWERVRLPIVFADKQLIYAAGIGMDCHAFAPAKGDRLQFRWVFDHENG